MNNLLNEALHAFGMDGIDTEFIQHNENAIYRVHGRLLLRIHKPVDSFMVHFTAHRRQLELFFLRHLHNNGLPVQTPIDTKILSDDTVATLLTWLEGHDLTKENMTPDLCFEIGWLAFDLHRAAKDFDFPGVRRYDEIYYDIIASQLDRMCATHQLGDDHAIILRHASEAVARILDASEDEVIAIHADLSPHNILHTAEGLVPIDFSLFGMGRPMLDLGILIASLSTPEEMKAVCEGYEAAGGVIRRRELEAGFAAGLLGCFAHHPDWAKEPWFREKLERWERQILLPVAESRPMFDDDLNFVNT